MDYNCTKCNMEKGMYIKLVTNGKDGEMVCSLDPSHKFKVDNYGFLKLISKRADR